MKAYDVIRELEKLAPPSFAESWDNSGLLIGSMTREISSVYIALDADSHAIDAAVKNHCDMIVTHHPMLFSAVKSIRDDDFIGKRIISLIENHINCYAMHTNFDAAVMGALCAEKLNIRINRPIVPVSAPDEGDAAGCGIGCFGTLNASETVTLRDFAAAVKTVFDLPDVRYYGDPAGTVVSVAMCPGSGKGFMDEVAGAHPDVYVTGDVDHHFALDMMEKGVSVIDAGHHGLEHVFVDYMMRFFRERMPELTCIADDNSSPFDIV